jgi:GNAT superfamily N-acetyltransferase
VKNSISFHGVCNAECFIKETEFISMVVYLLIIEYNKQSKEGLDMMFNKKLPNIKDFETYYEDSMQFVMKGKNDTVIGGALVKVNDINVSIELFAILPQKRGYGKILMDYLSNHFLKSNIAIDIIINNVNADVTAVGFYRKMGFQTIGEQAGETVNMKRDLILPVNYHIEVNPKKISKSSRKKRANKARKVRKTATKVKSRSKLNLLN